QGGAMDRQALPDLLGQVGHEGVEEAEASVQDREEGGLGSPALAGRLALRIIAPLVEPGLDQLNVGIAQVAPDKLVEDLGRLTRVEPLQEPVDLGSRP